MKRKIIYILMSLMICCMSLIACGGNASRAAAVTENRDIQKVLTQLEEGQYQAARELYDENVAGDINLEEEASRAFPEYMKKLMYDISTGSVDMEVAHTFAKAASSAAFDDYLTDFDFEYKLSELATSMSCFIDGKMFFDAEDYQYAAEKLVYTIQEDSNYFEAMNILLDCCTKMAESGSMNDWIAAEEYYGFLYSRCQNSLAAEDDSAVFPVELEKICEGWHDLSIKIAEQKYEEYQYQYAAMEYAKAATLTSQLMYATEGEDESSTLSEIVQQESELYREILRKVNCVTYEYGTYYILTEDGLSTRGDDPGFRTSGDGTDFYQLSFGGSSPTAFGIINEDYMPEFGLSKSGYNYPEWAGLTEVNNWYLGELPINIWLDGPDAAVLDCTGDIYVYMPAGENDVDVQNLGDYAGVVDFREARNGFAILQNTGAVHTTEGIYADCADWPEISAISTGFGEPGGDDTEVDGYDQWDVYIYGLTEDGEIYYSEVLSRSEYEHGQVPEYGVYVPEDKPVMIAGNVYMTAEGKLHSIDTDYEPWLQDNYGSQTYTYITNINPKGDENWIAAETDEGKIVTIRYIDAWSD